MSLKLSEMLTNKESKRKELAERAKIVEDIKELRAINQEIEILNTDIESLRSAIPDSKDPLANLPADARAKDTSKTNETFNPTSIYFSQAQQRNTNETDDLYGSLEYRQAFKNYIVKGENLPTKFSEQRSDLLTTVGDVGAIIPTTLQNRIIQDIQESGRILPRISQISVKGGIDIPVADINFKPEWLGSEEVVSETQKAELKVLLNFKYHVLEARVAIGFLTDVVSLDIFETTFVAQLKRNMVEALELAIINGTGVGQPLGFLKYNLPSEQIVTMTADAIGKVATWAGVEAIIPEEEEDKVIYMMAKGTWEKYLNGMTDTTGQRIGLGKINEKGQKILNGREVMTVSNFPSFDKAVDGDIFGVVINLKQYLLNTNYAMYYKKYFNDDKNQWIHKAIMIADGKMTIGEVGEGSNKKLVGARGLLYLKK